MTSKKPEKNDKNDANAGMPAQISPEMLKLIAAMQQKQMDEMPKYKKIWMQFMQKVFPKFQAGVHYLDRFANFVSKPHDKDRNDVVQAARAPILFGTWVIIIFFGFGMLWAGLAPLDSASHARGLVVSSTHKKVLQHLRGGTVKEIFVKQGDHVNTGDKILALDDTQFKAEHDIALAQYRSYKASEARLIAERDNLDNIEFAPELLKDAENPEVYKILATQRNLFNAKREMLSSLAKNNEQKILQLRKTIEGYNEKKLATSKQYEAAAEKLKSAATLMKKGFLSKNEYSELEARYAEAKSQDRKSVV